MENFKKAIFVKNLEDALKEKGLSQKELAGKAGVSESSISKYFNAAESQMPGGDKLARIAKALDVSVDWLLGLSERKKVNDQLSLHDIGEMLIQCINTPALSIRIDEVSSEEFYRDDEQLDKGELRENKRTAISFSDCFRDVNEYDPYCDSYAPYGDDLNKFIGSITRFRKLYEEDRIDIDDYKALLSRALDKLTTEPLPKSDLETGGSTHETKRYATFQG